MIRYRVRDWDCCSSNFEFTTAKFLDSDNGQHCRWIHTGSRHPNLNKDDETNNSMDIRIKQREEELRNIGESTSNLEDNLVNQEVRSQKFLWQRRHRESWDLERRLVQSMNKIMKERFKQQQHHRYFYTPLLGNPEEVALYIVDEVNYKPKVVRTRFRTEATKQVNAACQTIEQGVYLGNITEAAMNTMTRPVNSTEYGNALQHVERDYIWSLRAIATITRIYKALPHATIDVRILHRPLVKQAWIPPINRHGLLTMNDLLGSFNLDRQSCLSCVVQLESSQHEIEPGKLSSVLAVSTGDSIFVATDLLCDPTDTNYQQPSNESWETLAELEFRFLCHLNHPK